MYQGGIVPVNATAEYFEAERKYLEAKTREEKIVALEEMIKKAPRHKGAQHLLADLRKRLSKLKSETKAKVSSRPKFSIRKEGAAQICIVGLTNSGKSTLLNALTNAKAEVGNYEYTTKEPKVGMMFYNDLQFQLIEIPSTFSSESVSLLHSCDLILIILDSTKNVKDQKNEILGFLEKNKLENKRTLIAKNKVRDNQNEICVDSQSGTGLNELKEAIWESLDSIKIYTKSPRKPKAIPALALKKGSTVKDLVKEIHKDFMRTFKFARIFNSTKFSGKRVGLDYKLQDNDVVEIHTR